MIRRGISWLIAARSPDGGWGGAAGVPPSIEETAQAVEALAAVALADLPADPPDDAPAAALAAGVNWLIDHTANPAGLPAAPIGLYFARLWYAEKLYPLIFAAAALDRARLALRPTAPS
jgi:squalene-hopene/tetraprenyl-beta-curcumene cyclase